MIQITNDDSELPSLSSPALYKENGNNLYLVMIINLPESLIKPLKFPPADSPYLPQNQPLTIDSNDVLARKSGLA